MDPNQSNQNPMGSAPVDQPVVPQTDPMAGQVPTPSPVDAPVSTPEPVVPAPEAPVTPEPVAEEQPAMPTDAPSAGESGDLGGGVPPTTPPATV